MSTACVIVAAGSGTRLAAGLPKAFVLLAGRPLLVHAAERVVASGVCHQVVAVVPVGFERAALDLLEPLAGASGCAVSAVAGGADRRSSVAAGLAVLRDDVEVVLVHDAARCLAPPAQVAAVAAAVAAGSEAVVPGLPVADTVRRVASGSDSPDGSDGALAEPLDREALRLVQTPQGFARGVLVRAHAAAAAPGAPARALVATDDASLVELFGTPVHVVAGHEEALKVTRPVDLALAAVLLRAQQSGVGA